MNKKDMRRLLHKHIRHDSLSTRLFTEHSERYYSDEKLRDRKIAIWNLDDEVASYKWFLDNASSLDDLILGLTELCPFADDALAVAQQMSEDDFVDFKLCLVAERRGEDSSMSEAYRTIVLPEKILQGMLLAEKTKVPLGAALVRIFETEIES